MVPDVSHLIKIREELWNGLKYGRAAVMIGAGFSRNAVPASFSTRPFPRWEDLGLTFVDALYPKTANSLGDRRRAEEQAKSTSGVLRLAEEFQTEFPRSDLDELLLQTVPDMEYQPGELHELLLDLPWSDVLTTNWDTLLERAASQLLDRRYSIAQTIHDIPKAMRPRIVKLHGSFPSHRPFILSEEDFRIYPESHAPFVNLVQQVLMENVLCMIGFSGDDPNFLKWTGWVRDNLGKHTPPIYLVGIPDLTPTQRKLLKGRGIEVIDLSSVFPAQDPADINHEKLLLDFCGFLHDGGPPNLRSWPNRSRRAQQTDETRYPHLLLSDRKSLRGEKRFPKTVFPDLKDPDVVEAVKSEVLEQVDIWKANRGLHPGWLITPNSNREVLWAHTDRWCPLILKILPSLKVQEQFRVLFELNWRLEVSLVPLFDDMEIPISDLLCSVNPFAGELEKPATRYGPTSPGCEDWDWSFLGKAWVTLAIALLRLAREKRDREHFTLWETHLRSLARVVPEINSQLNYQQCLWGIAHLDYALIKQTLAEWDPSMERDPFWQVRKASLCGEIGQLSLAEDLAVRALNRIREMQRFDGETFALLSRESWAMSLVDSLFFAMDIHQKRMGTTDPSSAVRGRWRTLFEYGCNAEDEIRVAKLKIEYPSVHDHSQTQEKFRFEPGVVSRSFRIGGGDNFDQILPALQANRLVEEAGYVPHLGSSLSVGKTLYLNAAKRLEDEEPERALSIHLRASEINDVDTFFSRHYIATLSAAEVVKLRTDVLKSLDHVIKTAINSGNTEPVLVEAAQKQAQVCLELLSRIVLRLSDEDLEEELRRAIQFYQIPLFRGIYFFGTHLRNFFSRTIESMPFEILGRHVLDLLRLPIPGCDGFSVAREEDWPEPARFLLARTGRLERDDPADDWGPVIQKLVQIVKDQKTPTRTRALLRLWCCYEWEALSAWESEEFGKAIWSQIDASTGLPIVADIRRDVFVHLPSPSPSKARDAVRKFHLNTEIPLIRHGSSYSDNPLADELLKGIAWLTELPGEQPPKQMGQKFDWQREELQIIFDKVNSWWTLEGEELLKMRENPFLSETIEARFYQCLNVLETAVIPRCEPQSDLAKGVVSLIDDIEEAGIQVDTVLPTLLRIEPNRESDVLSKIRKNILASEETRVRKALRAVFLWLRRAEQEVVPPPPRDLLEEVGHIVASRRLPALLPAIEIAAEIVEKTGSTVQDGFLESMRIGLTYLREEIRYGEPTPNVPGRIALEQVPDYRCRVSALAAQLAQSGYGERFPVIGEWLEEARSDPLPEVRRAALTS